MQSCREGEAVPLGWSELVGENPDVVQLAFRGGQLEMVIEIPKATATDVHSYIFHYYNGEEEHGNTGTAARTVSAEGGAI
jgi:hypothetical protein